MEKPVKPKKPTFANLPYPSREITKYKKLMYKGDSCKDVILLSNAEINAFSEHEYYYDLDRISISTLIEVLNKNNLSFDKTELYQAGDDYDGMCLGITYNVTLTNSEYEAAVEKYYSEQKRRKAMLEQYSIDIAEYSRLKALYDYEVACQKLEKAGR